MKHIKYFIMAMLAVMIMGTQSAHALQVLSPMEGESVFVNISKSELNLIQFPFNGIRAYTSSQSVEIKVRDRQVLVSMVNQSDTKPQEVFFSTPYGTYLLMLVPKSVPAETIMLRINKVDTEEAAEWEREGDYTNRIKELTKALYLGNPPSGYSVSLDKADTSAWEGIEQTVIMTMTGAGLVGEIHELNNHGIAPVKITESEFYTDGVLAVSLSSHDLHMGTKEQVYIIRRKNIVPRYSERVSVVPTSVASTVPATPETTNISNSTMGIKND